MITCFQLRLSMGKMGVVLWYEAALPDRSLFCLFVYDAQDCVPQDVYNASAKLATVPGNITCCREPCVLAAAALMLCAQTSSTSAHW